MQQAKEEKTTQTDSVKTAVQDQAKLNKIPFILTGYLFTLMALYAVSMTMIGPIMPNVIADYQLRLSQGGLMMTFQSIGGILAILIGGMTADRFNKSKLIWFSFFTFGLALVLVGFVNIYSVLLLIFFFFGAGSRMTDTILNAYVSDLYKARRGYYLNLLHTFFGVGALIGPIYARYVLDRDLSWSLVFSFLGITCMLMILLMPFVMRIASKSMNINPTKISEKSNKSEISATRSGAVSSSETDPAHGQKQTDALARSKANTAQTAEQPLHHLTFIKNSPVIWLICVVMMLYVGHQVSLSIWIPMYMETHLLVSPTVSSLALSILWLGIILGRMISAHLTGKMSVFKILLGGSLLGAVLMTFGIELQQPLILIITLGLTGLFTGAAIPLLVTIACDRYPAYSGTASSMIFLSGTVSTMLFPWLVGRLAELFSFQRAMMLTWITLYIMVGFGIILRKLYHKPDEQPSQR